jgi:hypothetical protein
MIAPAGGIPGGDPGPIYGPARPGEGGGETIYIGEEIGIAPANGEEVEATPLGPARPGVVIDPVNLISVDEPEVDTGPYPAEVLPEVIIDDEGRRFLAVRLSIAIGDLLGQYADVIGEAVDLARNNPGLAGILPRLLIPDVKNGDIIITVPLRIEQLPNGDFRVEQSPPQLDMVGEDITADIAGAIWTQILGATALKIVSIIDAKTLGVDSRMAVDADRDGRIQAIMVTIDIAVFTLRIKPGGGNVKGEFATIAIVDGKIIVRFPWESIERELE